MKRHRNEGLRKICGCPRRTWPKCPHPWHFNFKWNGTAYRFSLDKQVGHRLTSKAKAKAAADQLRATIREGKFSVTPTLTVPTTPGGLTVKAFGDLFVERWSKETKHKATFYNDETMLRVVCRFTMPDGRLFGDKPIGAVTEDDVEAFLAAQRTRGVKGSTWNKYFQLFKSLSKWGVKKHYFSTPWLSADTELKRAKREKRNRRLRPDVVDQDGKVTAPGEERLLLQHAAPRLRRLIVAALETAMRLGELLTLQWSDVDLPRRQIQIRGVNTKDREARTIPLSARLAGELEIAKTAIELTFRETIPEDTDAPEDVLAKAVAAAHVFGSEIGEYVENIRTPWGTACKKAGITDLHFHDLRHEAGSRRLESGWPVHHVRELLGHANISTTDAYLNVTRMGLQESMRKSDEDRSRCKAVASEAPEGLPPSCNAEAPTDRQVVVH